MKKIIITGGTGFLGRYLIKNLQDAYTVVVLTRNPHKYKNTDHVFYKGWDEEEVWEEAYAVINLAGENIGAKKWTQKQKERIIASRVITTKTIKKSIEQCQVKPRVWLQASATGYYGIQGDEVYKEDSPKGKGFLAEVCYEWEKPVHELSFPLRKVIVRTGVVLAAHSSLFKQLTKSFEFAIKAIPGRGTNYLPWIYLQDEIQAIRFLLDREECSGIFNLTSPHSSSITEIMNEIGKYKKSIISIHIPKWFLEFLFGKEMTEQIILTNQKVYPERLLQAGFTFTYPIIQKAVFQAMEEIDREE